MIGTATDMRDLQRAGTGAFPRFHLVTLATTSSTQDVVRSAARRGAEPGYSCMADAQTAGRGRQQRRWTAPAGSALLCSVLVRVDTGKLGWASIAAGLAMRAAIASTSGYQARLKWPNDLLAGRLKLAGVLCEVEPATTGPGTAVAVGAGVNLRVPSFPDGVAGASLDAVTARIPTAARLFGAFLGELAARLDELERSGAETLRSEWQIHAAGIGETVTAVSGAASVTGIASALDEDGALLIDTGGGAMVRVLAGDVHIGLGPTPDDRGPEISRRR